MSLKHNLEFSGAGTSFFQGKNSILVPEDQQHEYELNSESLRTYADVTEKKKQMLVNEVLQIFPGSRVLSSEEVEELYGPSASGSAKHERAGRESARASKHRGKGKSISRNNSKQRRTDRRGNPGQVSIELSSGEGGTV